jgi:hypothetical protein
MTSHRRWASRDEVLPVLSFHTLLFISFLHQDIERLPHGMIRTAYDADTRQYTFLDTTDGTEYVSAPGNKYGTLVPAATATYPSISRASGRKSTRTLLPFPHFLASSDS